MQPVTTIGFDIARSVLWVHAEALKREPKFSVAVYLATRHYRREVDCRRHEVGLIKAGLPA
jgi:hypothetical protein